MRRLARGLRLTGALGLAACNGTTAPTASPMPPSPPPKLLDPGFTTVQLQTVAQVGATGEFLSFGVAMIHLPVQLASAVGSARALTRTAPGAPSGTGEHTALGLRAAATRAMQHGLVSQASAAGIFPDSVRGKTYVWDTTAGEYVASTTPGPPNGMRLTLYAVGFYDTVPARPLSAIGYTDFTDQSTAGRSVLGVTIADGSGRTFVNYTVSHQSSTPWTAAGWVQDGPTHLDLTSAVSMTAAALSVQTTMDVASLGVHIVEATSLSGTISGVMSTDFSLTSGSQTSSAGETLRFKGELTADSTGTVNGRWAVTVDGQAFATVYLGPAALTYDPARGVQLTDADQAVLGNLFITSEFVFATAYLLDLPAIELGV